MKAVDAESVAKELVKMFSRVGIPGEILTDQGSNFTSQLLAEIYRLLHIRPIRTTPYHPQTSGRISRTLQPDAEVYAEEIRHPEGKRLG